STGSLGESMVRWPIVCASGALAFAITAATGGADADPAWSQPQNIVTAKYADLYPQVATDAEGDSVAVWQQDSGGGYRVMATYRPAGGGWEPPATLSAHIEALPDGASPKVAMDAAGDVVVIWSDSNPMYSVHAVVRPAHGTWGRPRQLNERFQLA